ncbi:hypothetical protein SBOR_3063 [Sclerotinia borealis F-4128]|uniref:Methyltransferase domain-containing protein n=1 Tax=Sclerotinia borealis (strain F-4128) TaxID=1432307 RepID=W9CL26_SCLBF|nr:hypothetical protein SBOR_3063 [Sclerotinia borealis F-4128]
MTTSPPANRSSSPQPTPLTPSISTPSSTPASLTPTSFPTIYTSISHTYETFFSQDPGLHTFLTSTITLLPPSSQILDLGSGTGRPVASTLSAAHHHVFGLDFSASMVAVSRDSVPSATFVVGDMRSFDVLSLLSSGETFDAVYSILSLFTLSRPELEVMGGKWKSWVKKGGLLCICTIAADDVCAKEGVEGEGEGEGNDTGLYDDDGLCVRGVKGRFMGHEVQTTLFSKEGWRWLLRSNGFEVVSERGDTYRPPVEADSDVEMHWFLVARRV